MIPHKNGLASCLSTSTIAFIIFQMLFFLPVSDAAKVTVGYATVTARLLYALGDLLP